MTQWGYDDSDNAGQDNNSELDGPKALRDAYKALKAQNDELNQKLTSFLEDQSKAKVSQVFESLGIPGAANLYQGPADPEKAKEWATSMQSVFGTGNQGAPAPVADSQPALTQDQQAQYQRMTEAGQNGTPLGGMEAAQAAVGDATDIAGLIAAFGNATRTA